MNILNKKSFKYVLILLIFIVSLTINYNCDIEFLKEKKKLDAITILIDTVSKNKLSSEFVVYSSQTNRYGIPNINYIQDVIIKIPKNSNGSLSSLLPTPTKNCFTFTGWYSDAKNTTPVNFSNTSNLSEIYAGWTRNQNSNSENKIFKVTYTVDGTTFLTQNVDSCSSFTQPVGVPQKTGYTFTNWFLDPEHKIPYDFSYPLDVDVVLYAGFKRSFVVNFISNSKGFAQITVDSGALVTRPSSDPKEAGYTFDNWYTSSEYTNLFDFTTKIIENTNVFAKNIANLYEVTFDNNGGNGVDPVKASSDNNLHILPPTTNPTRLGFKLGGWNENQVSTSFNFDFNNDIVVNNMILYAQWYDANTIFNIKVADENGVFKTYSTNYNGKISPPPSPQKIGYNFIGWSSLPSGTGKKFDFTKDSVQSNLSLYPIFEPKTYTVMFEDNFGTNPITSTFTFGSVITAPANLPTRVGYTISSYNTKADGSGNQVILGVSTVSQNLFDIVSTTNSLSIYIIWTPIKYTVTYDNNGGSGVDPSSFNVPYNSVVPTPTTLPTRQGYLIHSWNTSRDGTGTDVVFEISVVTQNMTVYPIWVFSSNGVVVTFDKGTGDTDASPISRTVPAGSTVSCPNTFPTKAGSVFSKWNTAPNGSGSEFRCGITPVSSNITVYAQYDIIYTLTYYNNGGTGVSPLNLILKPNDVIPAPTTLPTYIGKLISKWDTVADGSGTSIIFGTTVITADTKIFPIWVDGFTITYDNNGGKGISPTTLLLPVGSIIPLPTTLPTKTGFGIRSWNTSADGNGTIIIPGKTTLTSNITLYPIWDNFFTVTFDNNGGSGVDPATTITDQSLHISPPTTNPTNTNLKLGGWNVLPISQTFNFDFTNDLVKKDMILYAQWYNASTVFSVKVTDANGVVQTLTTNYNGKLTPPATPTKIGYDFVGWSSTADGTGKYYDFTKDSIQSNLSLFPIFTPKSYSVTYSSNGGSNPSTATIKYDAVITAPNSLPTNPGYSISSWNTAPDGTGDPITFGVSILSVNLFHIDASTTSLTIYAIWTPIQYTITYNNNGGNGVSPASVSVAYNTVIPAPTTLPTRTGYSIQKWNTAAAGTGTDIVFGTSLVTGNMNVYPIWLINTYVVTFDKGSGDTEASPNTRSVNHGSTATCPTSPTKSGYLFSQWTTNSDGSGSVFYCGTTTVNSDITVYAQYLKTYTLTYDNNGGGGVSPASIILSENATITAPTNLPTRTGYTLSSWNTAADGSGKTVTLGTSKVTTSLFNIYANTTTLSIYAIWTPIQYTITYNNNSGSGVSPASVSAAYNTVIPAPTTLPTRTGYSIQKWNTAAAGTGTDIVFGTSLVTGNMNVYPIWLINTYVVTFDKGTGDTEASPNTRSVNHGSTATCPTSPTKSGYLFSKWTTNSDGTGTVFVCGTTLVTSAITVYAQYDKSYTLTYDNNGGGGVSPASKSLSANAIITAPTTLPTRTGYTLTSWNTASDGSGNTITLGTSTLNSTLFTIDANTTTLSIYAIWTINTYTITYNNNSGTGISPTSQTFTHGSVITAPTTFPTRSGFRISSWNTAANGTGTTITFGTSTATSSVTIYPIWAGITYYYSNNGGNGVSPASRSGFTAIFAPTTNPTKTCSKLVGWSFNNADVVATITLGTTQTDKDTTVYAIFEDTVSNISFTKDCGTLTLGGYTYKTVQIGNQCWLAENLRYMSSTFSPNSNSVTNNCHNQVSTSILKVGKQSDCENYGVYYYSSDIPSITSGITGWHLPTKEEYTTLFNAFGSTQALQVTGLYSCSSGFRPTKTGFISASGTWTQNSYLAADYWTSSKSGASYVVQEINTSSNSIGTFNGLSTNLASIRLVKD